MAIHKRDELVKENSDLKERIGELEEELANIFTEGSLLCRWLFNPDNFFQAMAAWLRSK